MKQQKQYPLMSIVVLNWNGLEDTKICLEHLRKLDYPNYEIIVVDNGSRQGNKEYLSKQKDIIYVDNPVNRGFTGGHIDGLAHCSGEYIVLLNNDAVMKHDYLTKALESFDDASVAAVGGRSYFWNDEHALLNEHNPFYSYQNIDLVSGEAFMQQSDFGVPQIVNNVSGSAVVVRRSVIDEVGYLYDRFFAYFEETDLFARMKRAGYKIMYDPRLRIWHRNGASSGASEGSHFFFYQIFRNRFIFAVRNFETKNLRTFLYKYSRKGISSLARYILRPGSQKVMHKAYAMAAFYNLRTLPKALASRSKLRRQLGTSTYNHILYGEQTGISFVFDCTSETASKIQSFVAHIGKDQNPLHEYVVVVTGTYSPDFIADQPNIRFVVDKGYFDSNPLNLGCIAARFDWMAVCEPRDTFTPDPIRQGVIAAFGKKNHVIAFGDRQQYQSTVIIHKEFFKLVGGFKVHPKLETLASNIIAYSINAKSIAWQPQNAQLGALHNQKISAAAQRLIYQKIELDQSIANNGKVSAWGKIKAKYYRIYQFSTLFQWLFLKEVTWYLKAARIKNLLLFTMTLRRKLLALELKHIRNEVIINRTPGDLENQRKVTKKRLNELQERPTDIPVFIICRDRLNDLQKLVAWLEKHGLNKITFIDNDSVYPPLVAYFNKTPYQVIKLYRNVGHTSPWKLGIIRSLTPGDFYIVSDPDVIPTEECPKDVLKHFLAVHKQFFMYQKVGFGLRIDDLPDSYPLKNSVIEWEEQFWKNKLADGVFEAGVDTTFAVYKPFSYAYCLHPSIRTDFPYVARHMPWYTDPKEISNEEKHYRLRADSNVNSWNADTIADRYAKEMKRSSKKKKVTSN